MVCKSAEENASNQSSGVSERAYHPEEIRASNKSLVVDAEYYLDSQVLPPILRLCDPIDNIQGAQLAKALGLDGSKYAIREAVKTSSREEGEDVLPLVVKCARCAFSHEFDGPSFRGGQLKSTGLNCSSCHQRLAEFNIANAMALHIRKCQSAYYTTPLKLPEDGTQSRTTRLIPLGGLGEGLARQHSETWLHSQLRYMKKLMDVDTLWERSMTGSAARGVPGSSSAREAIAPNPLSVGDRAVYRDLLARADQAMRSNGYRLVDLSFFLAPLGLQ